MTDATDATDQFVTAAQAAALVGVHPRSIRRAVERGELGGVKLGPHPQAPVRIRLSDLAAWVVPCAGAVPAEVRAFIERGGR